MVDEKELLEKDLCPRLPYGVKLIPFKGWEEYIGIAGDLVEMQALSYSSELSILFDDQEFPYVYSIEEVRPALYPMSNVVNPITHRGETFTPIIKLAELTHKDFDSESAKIRIVEGKAFTVDDKNGRGVVVYLNMDRNNYSKVKKLIEWMFALNLPEHLWVNVNSLKTNPYT